MAVNSAETRLYILRHNDSPHISLYLLSSIKGLVAFWPTTSDDQHKLQHTALTTNPRCTPLSTGRFSPLIFPNRQQNKRLSSKSHPLYECTKRVIPPVIWLVMPTINKKYNNCVGYGDSDGDNEALTLDTIPLWILWYRALTDRKRGLFWGAVVVFMTTQWKIVPNTRSTTKGKETRRRQRPWKRCTYWKRISTATHVTTTSRRSHSGRSKTHLLICHYLDGDEARNT